MPEEKKQQHTARNLLLGGTLSGLGLKALSNNLKPDVLSKFQNQENSDRLIGKHLDQDGSFANSFRILKDYATNGSELMNASVLGEEPKTIIKGLRSLPFLDEANKWKGESSDLHYDAFKAGPLPAFVRYFDERFEKDQMPQQHIGLMDKLLGKLDPHSFRREFSDTVNNYVEGQTGIKNYISGRGLSDVPVMDNPGSISKELQAKLLEGLGQHIQEKGSGQLKHQIQNNAHAAYDSYNKYDMNLITPLKGLADTLGNVGTGLLGATAIGGLGYGAYKLYNHFNKRKEKEYYHGSPHKSIKELNAGSYVTPDKRTAELMGRYHLDSGKTWSDEDLAEPHYFGAEPKWKREPKGIPHIYKVRAKEKDLDLLDNPYEHKTLRGMRVESESER